MTLACFATNAGSTTLDELLGKHCRAWLLAAQALMHAHDRLSASAQYVAFSTQRVAAPTSLVNTTAGTITMTRMPLNTAVGANGVLPWAGLGPHHRQLLRHYEERLQQAVQGFLDLSRELRWHDPSVVLPQVRPTLPLRVWTRIIRENCAAWPMDVTW
jgi:hypothetical protein